MSEIFTPTFNKPKVDGIRVLMKLNGGVLDGQIKNIFEDRGCEVITVDQLSKIIDTMRDEIDLVYLDDDPDNPAILDKIHGIDIIIHSSTPTQYTQENVHAVQKVYGFGTYLDSDSIENPYEVVIKTVKKVIAAIQAKKAAIAIAKKAYKPGQQLLLFEV